MGKEHFPEFLSQDPVSLEQGPPYIPQAQALEGLDGFIITFQGHQSRLGRDDGMTGFPGQGITVPRRTSAGIGSPSGGDDHRIGRKLPAVSRHHPDDFPLGHFQTLHPFFQKEPDAQFPEDLFQGLHYVQSPVALGEHPASPFDFHREPVPFQQFHYIPIGEGMESPK